MQDYINLLYADFCGVKHIGIWFGDVDILPTDQVREIQEWKQKQCYICGLVQDCSISIANALEILQSCTKPSIC